MQLTDLFSTLTKTVFIGPRISFRLIKMAAASVQVLIHRVSGFAVAARKPNAGAKREFQLMIKEKIDGSIDSMGAATRHLSGGHSAPKGGDKKRQSVSTSLQSLLASKGYLQMATRFSRFIISAAQYFIQIPMRIAIFTFDLFMHTTDPLYIGVTANAKRLTKKRIGKL